MKYYLRRLPLFIVAVFFFLAPVDAVDAQIENQKIESPVFIRFRLTNAPGEKFLVQIGGFRHAGEPWYMPVVSTETTGGAWSAWVDLHQFPWHERIARAGGIAEYPSLKLTAARLDQTGAVKNAAFDVQLADKPDEKSVVINFKEQTAFDSIAFLVPIPLRAKAKDFETGSQMTERHARWAKEATAGKPVRLKKFDIITSLWGHYDPNLAQKEAETLQSLGFNVLGNVDWQILQKLGTRFPGHTWLYEADADSVARQWTPVAADIKNSLAAAEGAAKYQKMAHWTIADEVTAVDFRAVDAAKLNGWFRAYLKSRAVTNEELGKPIDQIEYPAAAMFQDFLPPDAPASTRRLLYHAAKFGHWWSAKQLRQTTDLVHASLPQVPTETLLPSHGFFGNAWGAANVGMSYRMHDIFEVGAQSSVNRLSAEDWLGLNHMYGPKYTWSGGQTFGYFNALLRSAIGDRPGTELRALITPSDDKYLRLKAFSSLGQGAKSFFFWTFGPTFIGTENYWSDLRSEYDGIAKLTRTLEKAEDVLHPAKTVSDPVAILYSVSHDIWNTANHSAFVEKRLLWHALRHLQIQPDFVREEDAVAGNLKNYKVLYVVDWNISRSASAAIDEWVKNGGTLYMSAGAATRDEFNEPFSPPFAAAVWGEEAANKLITERHEYNERTDLPAIKPLTAAKINLNGRKFNLPVIGNRLDMPKSEKPFATFADGKTAGQIITYERGQIIAVGFMPMLAYGQLANFKPTTLEEKWTPEPREIIKTALDAARIEAVVKTDAPVVEADLLTGANGSALVLANYTYQPIKTLTIDVKIAHTVKEAVSTEGESILMTKLSPGVVRLKLPLKWTDIILLR